MADDTTTAVLTVKQYNAISELMLKGNVRQAAEAAGVGERTLWRWLKEPLFIDEYRLARREATNQAIARVQQVSGAAVSELLRLAIKARSEAVRLGACAKILDLAIKSVELEDIAARLAALEAAYAAKP
jgi:hypothetical protein